MQWVATLLSPGIWTFTSPENTTLIFDFEGLKVNRMVAIFRPVH